MNNNSSFYCSGNSKQDSSNSFSHPSCCTFKNWEYRPGVPNGKVHVGIGGLPGWKYFDRSLHLKKVHQVLRALHESALSF